MGDVGDHERKTQFQARPVGLCPSTLELVSASDGWLGPYGQVCAESALRRVAHMAASEPIDRSILTSSEKKDLDGRVRRINATPWVTAAIPARSLVRLSTLRTVLWSVGILLAGSAGFSVALEVVRTSKDGVLPAVFIVLMMAGLVGGVAAYPLVSLFSWRLRVACDAEERRVIADFCDEIGYFERIADKRPVETRRPDSGRDADRDDSPNYWATGTYDPERYGQFVRDNSPAFRQYVKDAYGSLDAYESNKPD